MKRIAVIGSVNMDLVVHSPRFPVAGETILGMQFSVIPGGKGANQAVAARRMGAEVHFIGRVGGDEFGATLRENLNREGISTNALAVSNEVASGVALITVDARAENTIIVVPGANAQISVDDVEAGRTALMQAGILLMQLEIPLATVQYAAKTAGERGVTVVLNAAPAQPLPPELLAAIDYLVVNETEAALLAGNTSMEPEQAARILRTAGANNVVVTRGEHGALLVGADGASFSVPAFRVQPVDTTAAGDAFLGAFAVALAEGKSAQEALVWGSAGGALAVTRAGAQPSLPNRDELNAFLAGQSEEMRK